MILAAALAAHWVMWTPRNVQIGIGVGQGVDEHLIFLIPRTGCGAGMKIWDGRYGDFEASIKVLKSSKVCDLVSHRASAEDKRHGGF